uniref:AlNc14C255G9720 protein n=1 Tax=Albugo laibachii Nc14 TaxID=890382 RepID=F0WTP4_9STRA|nr:AlNc14C255G9720 [Albugo laibachii Nc14]|eukprot:CCA24736.1 AlNc14C255G9720 [Albugo laibachii Nc14]
MNVMNDSWFCFCGVITWIPRIPLKFIFLKGIQSTNRHLDILKISVTISWLEADPTSIVALKNLYGIIGDTASGRMPTWLTELLASVLDTCGSDLYFQKDPTHALWVWTIFAEHFAALTDDVPEDGSAIRIRESRDWWRRVYFSSFDPTRRYKTEEWCEWVLYKAAVAQRMFGCESSVHFTGKVCKWVRTELEASDNVFSERLLALIVRLGFNKEYAEGEIVREHSAWGTSRHSHEKDLKVCIGSFLTRQEVIPNEAKSPASETNDMNEQQSPCPKKRKLNEFSSDSIIVNGIGPLPAYVAIIEELVYQKRDLYNPSISHIKTLTKRRIKHLGNSHSLVIGTGDMAHPLLRVPTVHDIRLARSYFRSRLLQSMLDSKKSILPVRCEQYINIWLLGNYTSVSQLHLNEEVVLQERILKMQDEMRRCVPRPQTTMLLTNQFSITSIRRKMLALRRLRRRILHSFATVTRQLAQEQYECGRVWLLRHFFNAAWTICVEKRQTNLISQQALKNTITSSLCSTYLQVVHPYRIQYRSILFEFHRPEKGYKPPGQRKRKFLVMDDAPKLLVIAKDRCSQLKPTLALIQAFIWIHMYFQTFPQLASIHLLPPAPETRNRSGAKTPAKNRPRKKSRS